MVLLIDARWFWIVGIMRTLLHIVPRILEVWGLHIVHGPVPKVFEMPGCPAAGELWRV